MKILFLLILIVGCGKKEHHLPPNFVLGEKQVSGQEAESTFKTILKSQETALSQMTEKDSEFRMREMITDIAVARTGILGLSALKANSGVEIRWGKRPNAERTTPENTDLVIDENMNLAEATDAVAGLAAASGNFKDTPKLRSRISLALAQIDAVVSDVGSATLGKWQFQGVRFDLNFSATGEIYFFTKAGPNLRLRMEWNRQNSAMKSTSAISQFVLRTLSSLNQVNGEMNLPGYSVRRVSIGAGVTVKKEWGLWKHSAGFLGFMLFVPAADKENFPVPLEKGFLRVENNSEIPADKFVEGLRKSLKTASFFADAAQEMKGEWMVREIKTVNDFSYTGLFGLADFTTRGSMEIDFNRNIQ